MAKIFISYRHEPSDARVVAWLAEQLTAAGHTVFFDRDIPTGEKFDECIENHLQSCDLFLIVVSRAAQESKWVRAELRIASQLAERNSRRPRIVPLILEDFRPEWPIEWQVILGMIQHISCTDFEQDRAGACAVHPARA